MSTVHTDPIVGATAKVPDGKKLGASVKIPRESRLGRWRRAAGQIVREQPLMISAMALGMALRVIFWITTNAQYEDALITITHAHNAVTGLGLNPHPGEGNVQGFTSALSVLVPLAGEVIHQGFGFTAIRLASLVAVCVAILYANRISRDLNLGSWARGFILLYLAGDMNQIFFGMAGMETEMAVAILLASIYHVRRAGPIAAGITLGLSLLVRPDFIIWVMPAALFLMIRNRRTGVSALAVAGVVIAPWVIFTTLYYGSPIPNTIIDKATVWTASPVFSVGGISPWLEWLRGDIVAQSNSLWHYFTPFLEDDFVSHTPVPTTLLLSVAGAFLSLTVVGVWRTRFQRNWWPVSLFLFGFLVYRIYFLPTGYFVWYLPPVFALFAIMAGAGIQSVFDNRRVFGVAASVGLIAAYLAPMPFMTRAEAIVQHQIEDRVRVPLGQYLSTVVKPGEAVASESAGYIGYYSRAKLYDWPGLTSPTVVSVMKGAQPSQRSLLFEIKVLRPQWLVLRPPELEGLRAAYPQTASSYHLVREFKNDPYVPVHAWGVWKINGDEDFLVLRLNG